MSILWKIARFAVSPTRFIFDELKEKHARLHEQWPPAFLFAALLSIPILVILKPHPLGTFGLRDWMVILALWAWPWSRIAEIVWAFLGEVDQRLKGVEPRSALKVSQRLLYLSFSYLELIIAFGSLYFFLPVGQFRVGQATNGFSHFFQAVYFSGMTITTTGYGDIAPQRTAAQLLSMLEPLAGLVLVAGGISIYMATIQLRRSGDEPATETAVEVAPANLNISPIEHLAQRINQLNKKCTQVLMFLSFAIAAAVILWTSNSGNSLSLNAAQKDFVRHAMKFWVFAIFPTLIGVAPLRELWEDNLRWYTWLRGIKFVALWAAVICIGLGALEFARAI